MANNPQALDFSDLIYYDAKIKKYVDDKVEASLVDADIIDKRLDELSENVAVLMDDRDEAEAAILQLQKDDKIITKIIADLKVSIEGKADKSDIPSLEGLATEDYVKAKIAEAQLSGGDVDLSNYYTKLETDTKIQEAVTDITTPDLSNYATKAELEAVQTVAGQNSVLIRSIDDQLFEINERIDNIEIPTKLSQFENDAGYITAEDIPEIDLSEYAKKSEIPEAELFIIDFNSPNFTDALEAYNSGKLLILTNAAPDTSSYAIMNYVRADMITFTKFLTSRSEAYGSFNTYYLHNDNTWEISSEVKLNKVEANVSDTPISDLSTIRIGKEVYKIPSTENLATKSEIDAINSRIDSFPEVPTKISQLENDSKYTTEEFVAEAIANAQLGGDVDLSNYYTKEEVDALIPTDYATKNDLTAYATHEEVETKVVEVVDTHFEETVMAHVDEEIEKKLAEIQVINYGTFGEV